MPSAGAKVWVRDPAIAEADVFARGTVISDTPTQITVQTESGTNAWAPGDIFDCNSTEDAVNDNCTLEVLNSATLLHNLDLLFKEDKIHSWISEILIVINPFKFITGIYSNETKALYKGVNWTTVEPHVFATAEMAFKHMELQQMSQSLLVSGESGAGKTETNKQLMNYLIWRAGIDKAANKDKDLSQAILDCSPILEALGNAKNTRNKNSSRFGKYVNLKFNRDLLVMGADQRTFLLEKSRVTNATLAGERSYHIFYQCIVGANEGGPPIMQGKKPEDFIYSSQSGCTEVPGLNELKEFHDMHKSLATCQFSDEDRLSLYDVVAACLFLGNLKIAEKGEGSEVEAGSIELLNTAKTLMKIEADLATALIEKVMITRGEEYHIALNVEASKSQRDAFVKHCYSMSFNLVVERVNQTIDVDRDFHKFIGLLDVFGFEVFVVNSFEQLCINYANERLHNFFLMRVFEVEIELYRMQNLQVPQLNYPDNAKVIELLEKAPSGVYPLLDAQCKTPKGSDKGFVAACQKAHADNPHFSKLSQSPLKKTLKGQKDEECFVVSHFAGDVCYTGIGWMEKNVDQLSDQFKQALENSPQDVIKQMCTVLRGEPLAVNGKPPPDKNRKGSIAGGMSARKEKKAKEKEEKGGAKSTSVGKAFLGQLKQLMREIATTHPYFVRCVKPNSNLKPQEFMNSMVLSQLERSGTIECVKLMQEGYPSRAPYEDLTARFSKALPDFMLSMEPQDFVQLLMLAANAQAGDYQLGQDMVFFRSNKGGLLQELMMMNKDHIAVNIVKNARDAGLAASDPQMASFLEKLEAFVEMRKKQKNEAMEVFIGTMLAVTGTLKWLLWGEKQLEAEEEASKKLQAMQRGKKARRLLEQKKAAKAEAERKAEEARKAEEEAKRLAEELEKKKAEAAASADKTAAEAAIKEAEEAQAKAAAQAKKAEEEQEAAKKAEADADAAQAHAMEEEQAAAARDKQAKVEQEKLQQQEDQELEEEQEDEMHEKWFKTVGTAEYHRYLMCKGVEWGFQYHNFYGDWELSDQETIVHGRPHYTHNTMYGGYAHLFHCMDPHYNVPRWVIGPAPGNENGWAFCESDAPTPHETKTVWISWDGFEWHTCKTFRFLPKEHELDGLSDEEENEDDEDGEEEEDEEPDPPPKKKGKKKKK